MSQSKEKKLAKIKNKKVWPFVLAIILTILVFTGISAVFLGIGIVNLVMAKFQNVYQMLQGVETSYTEYQQTGQDFSQMAENIYQCMPDIFSICVLDENDQLVQQYGDCVPDFSQMIRIGNNSVEENAEAGVGTIWHEEDLEIVQDKTSLSFSDEAYILCGWYVQLLPDGTQKLCIRVGFRFYRYEILNILIIIGVFLVFMLLLISWNVYMIVRVIRERRLEKDIFYTSTTTGGNNIQFFKDKAAVLLKANRRKKFNYAMVSIRLERYHNFCSCYGIKEGEELMESLFDELNKHLQYGEVAAHAEKADFVLLLKYEEEEKLTDRLEALLGVLKKVREDQKLNFGVGIYWLPKKHADIDTMYSYVKVVQETIAEDTEDHMKCFDESMLANQRWMRKLENDMERALANHEFQVYLQPKYSTKGEKLSGAEALVRWIHPTEGFIPPNRFIPIFEQNGFILELDDYMIREVAKLQAKWISEGKETVPISVNVSRAHFTTADLAEHICSLVDSYKVPHNMIELELTESAFFDDKDILVHTVKQLRDYGFDVSMDDFGAGYSSLNSLKELPLDVLKLDAEFFRGEDTDGRGDLIVGEAISLAKKLDMRIVAEGIETREQVDSLAEKNCDLIQGYYFAKPMPVEEFEKLAFARA